MKQFKFIARPNTWFIDGTTVELITDLTEWNPMDKIEDGFGEFYGSTNETFQGYDGELPRMDGEICNYDEFFIYYNDLLVNEMTMADILNNNQQK